MSSMQRLSASLAFVVSSLGLSMAVRRLASSSSAVAAANAANLSGLRMEYKQRGLEDSDAPADPFQLFGVWIKEAVEAKVVEPNAMCVATCQNNIPTNRYVLLKDFDSRGFVWYTNYESRKGEDLKANPHAAITFWWGELERQVRVEGEVTLTSTEESDAYFQVRPRGSQLGAWASSQSRTIANREDLDAQFEAAKAKFGDGPVPRPPHWGGYRLVPRRIEFWKGRRSRVHDRIVYSREAEGAAWTKERLQP